MTNMVISESPLQNKIASLLYSGKEPVDVAKIVSCTIQVVYDIKNSHKFAQKCYEMNTLELMTVGQKAAIDCLIEVVKDKKTTRSVRVSAADKLLHYTGLRVTEQGTLEKSPATMTQAEIQERLQLLQKEAANRAKTVTIEGVIVGNDHQKDALDTTSGIADINNLL